MNTPTQIIFQITRGKTFFVRECSKVAYGDDFLGFPDEKELLKAHLVVELMERYRYLPEAIHVGVYLPIKNETVLYAEIDIVVQDSWRNPFIVIAVEPPQTYEQNLEYTMRRLFAMAVLMHEKTTPQFLMYYTRWYEGANRKIRQIVVNYRKYQSFQAWHSAGRPSELDIPVN
ncbi:MAG: hypothetical protein AAB567_00715 [Patescibacteria group bacterium]